MPAAVLVSALLLLGGIGLSSSSGQAAEPTCTLVASTVGNDGNPGTLTQPVRTVQRLVDLLGPGQTGCLRGTRASTPFSESVTVANKNATGGSEANRITLRSYPHEIAKIRGALTVAESANFVTVSNLVLEARNTSGPSPRIDGDEVTFQDNNVSGSNATDCFRIGTTAVSPAFRTTITRNRIRDCVDGISATSTTNLLVESNLIYDNSGWGARLQPNVKSTGITRNVFDGNDGGLVLAGDASRTSTGAIIDRSVFSNSSPSSWNVTASWDPANVPPPYSSFVTRICSHDPNRPSTAGVNNAAGGFLGVSPVVNQDPQYSDRAVKDFHISASSPCHDLTGDIAQAVDDGGGPTDEEASADHTAPNVLFVITDDQRADGTITQSQSPQVIMPAVVDQLKKLGTDYSNAFAFGPLCCPSRGSIMSGSYPHNHGITNNLGAWNFDENPTLQAYLRSEGGYRTGIFGKYLNEWDLTRNPAHWDRWAVFNNGYCPFRVNEDGTLRNYGIFGQPTITECGAYSTHYVRDKALEFIDENEADDTQPWFMYLAPFAPHGPAAPEDKYADADVGELVRRAVHDEGEPGNTADPLTDKPDWVQGLFEPGIREEEVRKNQLRTLKSVDDMVDAVLTRLKERGEQDTLVVYLGDNGFQLGEHGLVSKGYPYTESVEVPLIVRHPPVTIPDTTDTRMVGNIDVAPTALSVAGLSTSRSPAIDGRSLFDPSNARSRVLLEFGNHFAYPATDSFRNWASTRTATYQYIESYAEDGATIAFREYYDLVNDPDQRFNLYGPDGQPGGGDDLGVPAQGVAQLSEQLRRDRLCVGTQCPPGAGAPPLATDQQQPSVQVTAPAQSAYVCCRVRLAARALDNMGVEEVEFEVDGVPVGSADQQEPFVRIWDTTGVSAGQHSVTAIARDAAGNERTSEAVTVTLSQMDVQIEDGPGADNQLWKPGSGDTVTYSFGRPINPGTVALGWNGTKPSSCAAPAPPGCVTIGVEQDDRYDQTDADSLAVYKDPQRTSTDPLNQRLTSLGTVDLAAETYVGGSASFLRSPMELVDGGTAVRITLADGAVGACCFLDVGTMKWSASSEVRDTANNPFCISCRVFESVVPWVDPNGGPVIDDEDREF